MEVATAPVDMAQRPAEERWAVPNQANGMAMRVERWPPLHPTRMVLEAQGAGCGRV